MGRWIGLSVLLLALGAGAKGEQVLRFEQLALAMGGHEVGVTIAKDVRTPDGYRFERQSELKIQRGATVVEMSTKSVAETDAAFRPRSFRFEKVDASGTFVLEGSVAGDVMSIRSGGQSTIKVPLEKDMTFASAMEVIIRQNLKDGQKLSRPVVIEEMGAKSRMTADIQKTAGGYRIRGNLHGLDIVEDVDETGRTVKSVTPALGAVAYPVGVPPPDEVKAAGTVDMLARSTWPAPVLPRSVKTVRYRVTTPDAAQFDIPEDRRQRVVGRTANTIDVEVRAVDATRGALTDKAPYLGPTPYEAIDDPSLRWVARDVTHKLTSPADKVKALVRFVYDHVDEKSLDRGYAPALSTLKSKAGDCTEHAVLLSALLRSLGIPTRLVDGVVVDGGRAGYHEWVEVYIEGRGFVPADPTFGEFPASPLRLKLAEGTSSPEGLLHLGIAAGRILRPGVKIEVQSGT